MQVYDFVKSLIEKYQLSEGCQTACRISFVYFIQQKTIFVVQFLQIYILITFSIAFTVTFL